MVHQIIVLALVALASTATNAASYKGGQYNEAQSFYQQSSAPVVSEPLKGAAPLQQHFQEAARPIAIERQEPVQRTVQYELPQSSPAPSFSAPVKGSALPAVQTTQYVEAPRPVMTQSYSQSYSEPIKGSASYQRFEQPSYQRMEQPTYQRIEQPTYQRVEQPSYQRFEQPSYAPLASAPIKGSSLPAAQSFYQEPARPVMAQQSFQAEPIKSYRYEQPAQTVQSTSYVSEPLKGASLSVQQPHYQELAKPVVAQSSSSWSAPTKGSSSISYQYEQAPAVQYQQAPAMTVQQSAPLVSEPLKGAAPSVSVQQPHYQELAKPMIVQSSGSSKL